MSLTTPPIATIGVFNIQLISLAAFRRPVKGARRLKFLRLEKPGGGQMLVAPFSDASSAARQKKVTAKSTRLLLHALHLLRTPLAILD